MPDMLQIWVINKSLAVVIKTQIVFRKPRTTGGASGSSLFFPKFLLCLDKSDKLQEIQAAWKLLKELEILEATTEIVLLVNQYVLFGSGLKNIGSSTSDGNLSHLLWIVLESFQTG